MGISDVIASFIQSALDETDGVLELQRSDLAQRFNCVPSQINYVISTRFSPEHGYIVESRRGGNGYIRITRVRTDRETLLMHVINSIGDELDAASARAIVQNLVNIAMSLTLVCGLKMGIVGVAVGTLASQYVAAVLAVALGLAVYRKEAAAVVPAGRRRHFMTQQLAGNREQRQATRRFLAAGRDIFLRTICLVAVTTQFTAAGAALSDTALAANALLMQFFIVFSYIMDGFAYAAEAIGGKLYGAGDTIAFRRLIRCLTGWGAGLAAAFTLIYATSGSLFIRLLTDIPEVVTAATALLPFVVAIPVAGVAAFLFDGLFIGTTSTREMLVAILVSAIAFFALLEGLPASWQAAGLWTAFLCYLILRGTVAALLCPGVLRRMQQNKA